MRVSEIDTDVRKAAGALIHAKAEDTWLFILRSEYVDNPFTWGLPGGHGSFSESYLDIAIRETKEETGYDLSETPSQLIYIHRSDLPTTIYKTFAFCIETQFKPLLDWENADYKWCKLDEFPTPMHWGIDAMLNSDLSGEILHKWLSKREI